MSVYNDILQNVFRDGEPATQTVVTGTTCPCMTSRDSARPSYSAQWHRDNTGSLACNGTGKITTTSTVTNVKGVFVPVMLYSNTPLYDQIKEVIGEIQQDDLICFGLVKTSDGTIIDMSAMVERKDKLTLRSMDFVVRTVQKFQMQGGEYQLAFCKRNT